MPAPDGRLATFVFALAAPLVVATCGSNGSTPGKDAAVVFDAGGDGVSCAALPCLAGATSLIAFCAPSGTCTEHATASVGSSVQTKCFSNGVTIAVTGMSLASGGTSSVMTVRKDGATCYSFAVTADDASGQTGSVVYADGTGVALITGTVSGADLTYTCPGGSPVVPDSTCDAALFALRGLYPFTDASGTCTTGTCSP
jgi:hypothetical protein